MRLKAIKSYSTFGNLPSLTDFIEFQGLQVSGEPSRTNQDVIHNAGVDVMAGFEAHQGATQKLVNGRMAGIRRLECHEVIQVIPAHHSWIFEIREITGFRFIQFYLPGFEERGPDTSKNSGRNGIPTDVLEYSPRLLRLQRRALQCLLYDAGNLFLCFVEQAVGAVEEDRQGKSIVVVRRESILVSPSWCEVEFAKAFFRKMNPKKKEMQLAR